LRQWAPSPTPPGDDTTHLAARWWQTSIRIVTPNGVDETFEVVLGGARQVVNDFPA